MRHAGLNSNASGQSNQTRAVQDSPGSASRVEKERGRKEVAGRKEGAT